MNSGQKPSVQELRKRFFYQPPPDDARVKAHEAVSQLTFELACKLTEICPSGRNLSVALTKLEDVRMRANAALATESD